jgi:hypothetical protein
VFGGFLTLLKKLPARMLEGPYSDILKKPASALSVLSSAHPQRALRRALQMLEQLLCALPSAAVIILLFLSKDRWLSHGDIGFWPKYSPL